LGKEDVKLSPEWTGPGECSVAGFCDEISSSIKAGTKRCFITNQRKTRYC